MQKFWRRLHESLAASTILAMEIAENCCAMTGDAILGWNILSNKESSFQGPRITAGGSAGGGAGAVDHEPCFGDCRSFLNQVLKIIEPNCIVSGFAEALPRWWLYLWVRKARL